MLKSHEWIQKERETLRKKYPNKVILICECEIIKVFDTSVKIREVFDEADFTGYYIFFTSTVGEREDGEL